MGRLLSEEMRKQRNSNWLLWFRYWRLKRELTVARSDPALHGLRSDRAGVQLHVEVLEESVLLGVLVSVGFGCRGVVRAQRQEDRHAVRQKARFGQAAQCEIRRRHRHRRVQRRSGGRGALLERSECLPEDRSRNPARHHADRTAWHRQDAAGQGAGQRGGLQVLLRVRLRRRQVLRGCWSQEGPRNLRRGAETVRRTPR